MSDPSCLELHGFPHLCVEKTTFCSLFLRKAGLCPWSTLLGGSFPQRRDSRLSVQSLTHPAGHGSLVWRATKCQQPAPSSLPVVLSPGFLLSPILCGKPTREAGQSSRALSLCDKASGDGWPSAAPQNQPFWTQGRKSKRRILPSRPTPTAHSTL